MLSDTSESLLYLNLTLQILYSKIPLKKYLQPNYNYLHLFQNSTENNNKYLRSIT